MPRTQHADDSLPEDFAGLLERLTQRTGAGSARTELDSVRLSVAGLSASAERRERTLAPVTEVKPRRLGTEAAPLSYEKALRLHSRHSLAPDLAALPDPGSAEPVRKPASAAGTGTDAASRSTAPRSAVRRSSGEKGGRKQGPDASSSGIAATRSNRKRMANRGAVHAAPVHATPAHASPSTVEQRAAAAQLTPTAMAGAPPKGRGNGRKSSRANSPAGPLTASQTSSVKPAPGVLSAPAKAPEASADNGRRLRSRSRGAVSLPDDTPLPGGVRKETAASRQAETLQLELARRTTAIGHRHADHRHATVSIRLNDAEFDRLRERAAESGISVSAYMRSCVLDAEHLRTQVKQALAEMRASAAPREQALLAGSLPVLAGRANRSAGGSAGGGNGWSRLLWKSATFFLGPWFPFRHRA